MINPKILGVSMEMLRVMQEVFPPQYLDFLYTGLLDPGDVIEMLMLELIKNTYYEKAEKHSMKYFFEKYGIDEVDQRMRYSRIQSYIMKYRQKEYDDYVARYGKDTPVIKKLIPPDMSDMKTKIEGYKLTEMNFFETTTILENEFTKAVTEKRLIDSKKVSNERFVEIVSQYDLVIQELNEKWGKSAEDTVFSSIAAFTLEWKYPVHFLYEVARRMEELGIPSFPDQRGRLSTFCAEISVESLLDFKFHIHSRMVTVRDRYIELMLTEPEGSDLFDAEQRAYLEGLAIVSQMSRQMTMDDIMIGEWFLDHTNEEDWAAFFSDYNVFAFINDEPKTWTNKRIRYFRECLKLLTTR